MAEEYLRRIQKGSGASPTPLSWRTLAKAKHGLKKSASISAIKHAA